MVKAKQQPDERSSPGAPLPMHTNKIPGQPQRSARSLWKPFLVGALTFCELLGVSSARHLQERPSDNEVPRIGHRNPAYLIEAKHGAVAAENKRCSDIGVQILQEGGNAVDAAI
ncbi:hypothetical protein DXG01_008765, partial [Tephrocybe rancida]